MKLALKEITQVPVGKRKEDSYRYEDETGQVIVEFNAGKQAWTWEIGLATTEAGRKILKATIEAFMKAGSEAVASGSSFDEAIKTLEVSE